MVRVGAELILLCAVVGSCASTTPAPRPNPADEPDTTAIARDCVTLLAEYAATDFERASENELERQMQEADLNREVCEAALLAAYEGPGGPVMASHIARELGIHSLRAELALSARFDELAGYCEILRELVMGLGEDLTEIETGLTSVDEADRPTLTSLRDLTSQTLEVSLFDFHETCQ